MDRLRRELEEIMRATGVAGIELLRPEDVIEYARTHPDSALYGRMTWDEAAAAHKCRLEEARKLIRVCVTVLPGRAEPVRAFVSLTPDRRVKGGGYRPVAAVLSDADRRRQLLNDALAELNTFQRKYALVEELAGVFAEIDRLRRAAERGEARRDGGRRAATAEARA